MASAEGNDDGHRTDLDRLKLKFEPWQSDREDFVLWMNSVTGVVRSLTHSDEIEDWLDRKLERTYCQEMMVSALITEDPDFVKLDHIGDPEEPKTVTKTLFTQTPRTIRSVQSLRQSAPTTYKSAGSFYKLSAASLP